MFGRRSFGVVLLLLAFGQLASASWLHNKLANKLPQAEVSGVRGSSVRESGARAMEAELAKGGKDEKIKQLLGLSGPMTVSQVPAGCKSAWDLLQANKENFTFLINALKATGLESVFADPALKATVFAPNDEAFTALIAELGVSPQELFDDVLSLTIVLKYHVIPGLTLNADDFKDSQGYYTLLTDKKKNKYQVVFDYEKTIDLKAAKKGDEDDEVVSKEYTIVPSGGDAAEFDPTKNLNPGCPTAVYIIDAVLLPAYEDEKLVQVANAAINAVEVYEEAGYDVNSYVERP